MFKIIFNTNETINHSAKHQNITTTIGILLGYAILSGISLFVVSEQRELAGITAGVVLVSALLLASFLEIVMKLLSGHGGFREALISLTNALAAPTLAVLLSSLAYLILKTILLQKELYIMMSVSVAVLFLIPAVLHGIATLFVSLRETYDTDMSTVLAGVFTVIIFLAILCGALIWIMTAPLGLPT